MLRFFLHANNVKTSNEWESLAKLWIKQLGNLLRPVRVLGYEQESHQGLQEDGGKDMVFPGKKLLHV